MVPSGPPPLLLSTRALCRQESFDASAGGLTLEEIPGRLGLAVVTFVSATWLGLVLPSRYATTPEARWGSSILMGMLVAAGYLYSQVVRPLLHRPADYRLVGEFVVREKFEVFGRRLLRIGPSGEQHVRVGPGLYERLRVGDQVQVIYTAAGDLVSVAK